MRTIAQKYIDEGIQHGIIQGIEKGIEKGKAEGKAEERVEIAKKLLSQGCNTALISSVTGLDKAFISSLE